MKNFLLFLLFIILLGIAGHFDYIDAVSTAEYDRINKQEVIKDIQLRCFKGELKDDMFCKGI